MSKNKNRRHAPGGDTIRLPRGHSAVFWSNADLPIWKDRELSIIAAQINRQKMKALSQAKEIEVDGAIVTEDDILEGARQTLSENESRTLYRLTDSAIWAYLKSWTLRTSDGNPIPIPETADELIRIGIDKGTYDALAEAANKRWLETQKDDFTVDGGIDEETGTPIEGTPTEASNS